MKNYVNKIIKFLAVVVIAFNIFSPSVSLAGSYVNLADITLGSANATLFSGALADYPAYKVYVYIPSKSGGGQVEIRFNGDTGNNYVQRIAKNGAGTSTCTGVNPDDYLCLGDGFSSQTLVWEFIVTNYESSTKKSIIGQGFFGDGTDWVGGGIWNNTSSKITSMSVTTGDTFASGSRIIIEGISPDDPSGGGGGVLDETTTWAIQFFITFIVFNVTLILVMFLTRRLL